MNERVTKHSDHGRHSRYDTGDLWTQGQELLGPSAPLSGSPAVEERTSAPSLSGTAAGWDPVLSAFSGHGHSDAPDLGAEGGAVFAGSELLPPASVPYFSDPAATGSAAMGYETWRAAPTPSYTRSGSAHLPPGQRGQRVPSSSSLLSGPQPIDPRRGPGQAGRSRGDVPWPAGAAGDPRAETAPRPRTCPIRPSGTLPPVCVPRRA